MNAGKINHGCDKKIFLYVEKLTFSNRHGTVNNIELSPDS